MLRYVNFLTDPEAFLNLFKWIGQNAMMDSWEITELIHLEKGEGDKNPSSSTGCSSIKEVKQGKISDSFFLPLHSR